MFYICTIIKTNNKMKELNLIAKREFQKNYNQLDWEDKNWCKTILKAR